MWKRRKPASAGPVPQPEAVSLLEAYFPAAVEEHPAKRRIRRANDLADEMRQTGGRHKLDVPAPRASGEFA